MRVLLFGATGTIGRAAARAMTRRGCDVVAVARRDPALDGASARIADVADVRSLKRDAFRGERFDAVVSCLASRTGAPDDAWTIDYKAHADILSLAADGGASKFVLLSASCVQKPRLAFQHAKLAFERDLAASGLDCAIVRPTAYFKSLSGQIDRVRRGEPFLIFGDGELTRTMPISDDDLADFLAARVTEPPRGARVLPIGGPGPAITPRDCAERLFALAGRPPRFRRVPVALFRTAATTLGGLSRVAPALAAKAEYARIATYYATESMLVWDEEKRRYDADATEEHGSETLFEHYARRIAAA
ncbi:MAG: NAD(P)H-binding protein [Parvularculaceae bacterium]